MPGLAVLLSKAAKGEEDGDGPKSSPEAADEEYGTEDCARRLCVALGVDEEKAPEVANILSEFIELHMGESE